MRTHFLLFLSLVIGYSIQAQKRVIKNIDRSVSQRSIESHLRFYASDEMRGRNTATIENEIAAKYIAERMRAYGVSKPPGHDSFFQKVPLIQRKVPSVGTFTVGDSVFSLWDDLIFLTADNLSDSTEFVFINYGTAEDFEQKMEGKVAVGIYALPPEGTRLSKEEMIDRLIEKGAIALLELYRPSKYDWPLLINYLSGDQFELAGADVTDLTFPTGWIVDGNGEKLSFFKGLENKEIFIEVKGAETDTVEVPNVVGYIEGTDPDLKEEYILISAHLDHVGVKNVLGAEDSIWNGARDNGIGITNMLTAAEYFGENPPKRSIIFLACNAEEVGLLGSQWYADHPLFPLNKTVFNINTDTGGYNDSTKVTVVGLDRTSIKDVLMESSRPFGLETIDDPVPEENTFDRSDNVSFAEKGIPAISYGPGYTSKDEEIDKYYHQPGDEPSTINYPFITQFCKAYIYTVWQIANHKEQISWKKGDKYEPAGDLLYGR